MKRIKLDIQRFAGGIIDFGASGALQGRIVWGSSSNGASANSSNVSAELQIHRTDSYKTTGTFTGNLQIGGDNRSWSWYGSLSNGWVAVMSFTTTIGHAADGSGSCYIGGSVNGPSGTSLAGKTSSGGQTVGLDKINRYATTNSVSGQNIEENFSANYTKYVSSWSYKLRISIPGVQELERINYNTSGTSFKLSQSSIDTLYNRFGPDATFNLGFAVETWSGNTRLNSGNEVQKSCKTLSKGRILINGTWKNATLYVYVNGTWKKVTPFIRINNEWKRGK